MFCEKCGAANDAGAKFCAFCGNAMESEEIVAAPEKSLPVTPYAKWILLGAAAVVVVLLLAIFGAFKPGAVRVVEKYTKGTIRANAGDVYKAIDLPYTRDEDMDKEDIRDIIEGMQERLEEIKEERK